MNENQEFKINGESVAPQAKPRSQTLAQWIESLRSTHAERDEIVTELRIDGTPFVSDDPRLAYVPAEAPALVEVFTRPQTEVALETLEGLIPFIEETARICELLPSQTDPKDRAWGLRKLCEGLELLTDALETAKKALNLRTQEIKTSDGESIALIEADLLSILQDWADCQSRGDKAYEKDLLETHLPQNLRLWSNSAIPALIR